MISLFMFVMLLSSIKHLLRSDILGYMYSYPCPIYVHEKIGKRKNAWYQNIIDTLISRVGLSDISSHIVDHKVITP